MPSAPAPAPPLRRTAADRVLLGVCGGLARTLDVRPLLVRAAAVLFAALAFPLLLAAYAAAALIVPRDDGRVLLGGEPADGREQLLGWTVVLGAGFLVLAAGFAPGQLVWPALSEGSLVLAGLAVIALAVRDARGAAVAPVAAGASAPAAPPAATASAPVERPGVPSHRPTDEEPTVADAPARPASPTVEPTAVQPTVADAPTRPAVEQTAVHAPVVPRAPARRRRTGLLVAGTIALVLAALATAGAVAAAAIGGADGRAALGERAGAVASEYGLGVDSSAIDHLRGFARGPASLFGAGG